MIAEHQHPPYQSPTEVAPGIYMVPVPVPIPLRYVNCYLCKGPSGWTIIDTGFHDDLAMDAWTRALDELGIRFQDIDRILVTHYHPDHIGAAGWLQEKSGALAFMHEPEIKAVKWFWNEETERELDESLRTLFRDEGGLPAETTEAMVRHHHFQFGNVQPIPTFTPVPSGSQFRIGADEYEVIWLPGHSDGLAVFYNAGTGIVILNDMLLNKITPNVSLWPGCRTNPLQDYLSSLGKLEDLGARLGLPGHRTLITDVAARAREVRQHHAERLNKMEGLCAGTQGATAWEVCQRTFKPEELTIHQLRFAMAESLAHLVYMERQGRLLKKGIRYVQA